LSGDSFNHDLSQLRGKGLEEYFVSSIKEIDSKMAVMTITVMESIVSYLYDNLDVTQTNLCLLKKYENELLGHFTMGFVQTWISTFHYECFLKTGKRRHKRLGRVSYQRVRHWATTGTTMLLGPYRFLDAMVNLCVYKTPVEQWIVIFQEAASSCAMSHCRLFEAFANERLAKALYKHESAGFRHAHYQDQAVRFYRNWGATAKANHVERMFL
jgi:hypothetical protein